MKKILIVGATSAIAHACARIWASRGAEFFLVARCTNKLQANAADLNTRGAGKVHIYPLDILQLDQHQIMLEHCLEQLGQIDIALIAHGTLPDQQICQHDSNMAVQEFTLNATSMISIINTLAIQLERQRCGSLAVISSVAGDRGRPSNYLYGSAKGAVSIFCAGLHARLYKKGVQVLTIKPGFVDTPMTAGLELPTALLSTPEKVASQIVCAVGTNKAVLYTPGIWRWIMLIIRSIPMFIFRKLNL